MKDSPWALIVSVIAVIPLATWLEYGTPVMKAILVLLIEALVFTVFRVYWDQNP